MSVVVVVVGSVVAVVGNVVAVVAVGAFVGAVVARGAVVRGVVVGGATVVAVVSAVVVTIVVSLVSVVVVVEVVGAVEVQSGPSNAGSVTAGRPKMLRGRHAARRVGIGGLGPSGRLAAGRHLTELAEAAGVGGREPHGLAFGDLTRTRRPRGTGTPAAARRAGTTAG